MKQELIEQAHSLGIAESVQFLGFIPEAGFLKRLERAHFFVHPSQTGDDGNVEGVPNSLLEAMATGLPSLATTHGGIPEAIDNGVSGILVDEQDADALADAALELAKNPEKWQQIAREGRAAIERKFSTKAQRRDLESLYAGLVDNSLDIYHKAASKLGLT